MSTTEVVPAPAWAESVLPPVPVATAPPPPPLPAEAWEPDALALVEAGASLVGTWTDREATAVPPEPEPVGEASALLDVVEAVLGLPPVPPEMATGSLVEMAVASPVSPLLEADEVAVDGPELPEVAVGLDTTFEPPPEPPPEVPVVALPPPVLDWLGPANAGEAKNKTVVIAAATASHETMDRRCVVSAMNPGLRG